MPNFVSDDGYSRGSVGVHFYKSEARMRRTTAEKKGTGVAAVIGATEPKLIPNLGLNTTGEYGNNRFLDNTNWFIWAMGLSGDDVLKAEQNWYGTTEPDPDKFSSKVDWDPFLDRDPWTRGRPVEPGALDVGPELSLSLNWPNPFNPVTSIKYGVQEPGRVSIKIYAGTGQLVRTLVDEHKPRGYFIETWDGTNESGALLPSGVYFCKLEAGGLKRVRKLVLVK